MTARSGAPQHAHVEDGALVRLLDRECSAEERDQVERHLAACERCAGRRRALVAVSHAVHRALAAADWPTRPFAPVATRPSADRLAWLWRWPAWRVAAVFLAIAAVAASAQPVRKWIAAGWAVLRGSPPPSTHAVAPGGAAVVRFKPAGPVFTIEVVARQAAGTLTVELISDSIASARVIAGNGQEELVVLPDRLRIVNRPATPASYHVRLPAGLHEVRVVIADAVVWELAPTPGAPWTFELKQD